MAAWDISHARIADAENGCHTLRPYRSTDRRHGRMSTTARSAAG